MLVCESPCSLRIIKGWEIHGCLHEASVIDSRTEVFQRHSGQGKEGKLGGYYCKAGKSYRTLNFIEVFFFFWSVLEPVCRVNNTKEQATPINTQFSLSTIKTFNCILIHTIAQFPQDVSLLIPLSAQDLSCSELVCCPDILVVSFILLSSRGPLTAAGWLVALLPIQWCSKAKEAFCFICSKSLPDFFFSHGHHSTPLYTGRSNAYVVHSYFIFF